MRSEPGAVATGLTGTHASGVLRSSRPFPKWHARGVRTDPVAIAPGTDSSWVTLYSDRRRLPADNLRIETAQDEERLSAKDFRFAIVASRWNDSLVSRLVAGALEALKESQATDEAVEVFRVPGSFEIPLCALKAAQSGKFDAVICLGVIIRGDTPHFDYVAAETARGITNASLQTGVPLLFGVITADNVDQANARAGTKRDNKGYDAALAAVEVVNLYSENFAR